MGPGCPPEWRAWVKGRIYRALEAPRNLAVRSKEEQIPKRDELWMMETVHHHFAERPVEFENFAAAMWVQLDPHVASVEVTRPSRDGGRDAIGEYRIGPASDPVRLQFALEAKCYDPSTGSIGIRMVSRLISRIKHREFGVFVTTSFIADQAYKEVREDGHPIIFLTGADLVNILKRMGLADRASLSKYLTEQYPISATPVADAPEAVVPPADVVPSEVDEPVVRRPNAAT